jgi:hypothetical protein
VILGQLGKDQRRKDYLSFGAPLQMKMIGMSFARHVQEIGTEMEMEMELIAIVISCWKQA